MSRPYNAFKVFWDGRSDFDREMIACAKMWFRRQANMLMLDDKISDDPSVRELVMEIEADTGLDEARARDLIKRLELEV